MRTLLILLFMSSVAMAQPVNKSNPLAQRLVFAYTNAVQKDVGTDDTTNAWLVTTKDYTGTYRWVATYVRTRLISHIDGAAGIILQHKPMSGDTLAWFNYDSFAVNTAEDTNYFYNDSLKIPPTDSVRFIMRVVGTVGTGDSIIGWNMSARLYSLEKGD